MRPKKKQNLSLKTLKKKPTGIRGFDEISFGGIPQGRATLICGNTGCGKTLMALEILIRGAIEFNEPGVFFTFEETKDDLFKNFASMGFDLEELERKKLILIQYIFAERKEYTETGEYNLEGLFIQISNAVKSIQAQTIVLDTIEVLFSSFSSEEIVRSELRRLFLWCKENQLTTIVTGEQGTGANLTRHGIGEYVADCVIFLNHRVVEDLHTRRLQIIKYRGSLHETNDFPFLITDHGIWISPITSLELTSPPSNQRISSGIPKLDEVLNGKGYFKGSSILISGSAGSGKTSFAGAFARSVYTKKQKCLFISYEESKDEIVRNLSSVGIDFKNALKNGSLKIIGTRPTHAGFEKHLAQFIKAVEEFKPYAVIIDPISTLAHCGSEIQMYSTLVRMIDYLKKNNITFLITLLYFPSNEGMKYVYDFSSVIDTWVLLRNSELNGELSRELFIIKSRGMSHSNQVREFHFSNNGIVIKEPYYGESGVLTGTARMVQENKDLVEGVNNKHQLHQLHDEVELKKKLIKMQIEGLQAELKLKEKKAHEEEKMIHLREEIHFENQKNLKETRSGHQKKTQKATRGKKRNS
jgi:circadian clock protein KaiC